MPNMFDGPSKVSNLKLQKFYQCLWIWAMEDQTLIRGEQDMHYHCHHHQHHHHHHQVSQTKDRTPSGSFLKTPQSGTARSLNSQKSPTPQVIRVGNHTLPAFVQVETLHPGQVFGLRSCLDPEERGPSVSLVSGECEVLQINKKFFMKHCDDAIYSLIRLKAKPWPSQEDLIDRLDVNMQWEEYKQQTLNDFLQRCRRFER